MRQAAVACVLITFASAAIGCGSFASIYRDSVLRNAETLQSLRSKPWMTSAAMNVAARECPTTRLGMLNKLIWQRCIRTVHVLTTLGGIATKLQRFRNRSDLLPVAGPVRLEVLERAKLNADEWAVAVDYTPDIHEGGDDYRGNDALELVDEIASALVVDGEIARLGSLMLKNARSDGRASARAVAVETNILVNLAVSPRWTLPMYREALGSAEVASLRSLLHYRVDGARASEPPGGVNELPSPPPPSDAGASTEPVSSAY